jgi:hypothetical protein
MGTVRDLHDFLEEAELLHYYSALCNQLRITTVPQLKYVEEDDLAGIGMSRPEMRRLKKMYKKECPHGALGKIKKVKTGNMHTTFFSAQCAVTKAPNLTYQTKILLEALIKF